METKKTLSGLRFLVYNKMVAKNILNPNRLLPTIASATEHILRVYPQYHNWVMLNAESLNPLTTAGNWFLVALMSQLL